MAQLMPLLLTVLLFDHIYYSEGLNEYKDLHVASGNFWIDLTDHLLNFFIIVNNHQSWKEGRPMVRIFSKQNINTFKNNLRNTDWDYIYSWL